MLQCFDANKRFYTQIIFYFVRDVWLARQFGMCANEDALCMRIWLFRIRSIYSIAVITNGMGMEYINMN